MFAEETVVRMIHPIFLVCSLLAAVAPAAFASADAGAVAKTPSPPIASPVGYLPPVYRITGVRSSAAMATAIHCTNLDSVNVDINVDFFEYSGAHACYAGFAATAPGTTRTLTTANTDVFSEDSFCPGPAPPIGQGYAAVSTYPVKANIICSAELVSVLGNPPTTLGALDVYRVP